jgi:hypothetical protein
LKGSRARAYAAIESRRREMIVTPPAKMMVFT